MIVAKLLFYSANYSVNMVWTEIEDGINLEKEYCSHTARQAASLPADLFSQYLSMPYIWSSTWEKHSALHMKFFT